MSNSNKRRMGNSTSSSNNNNKKKQRKQQEPPTPQPPPQQRIKKITKPPITVLINGIIIPDIQDAWFVNIQCTPENVRMHDWLASLRKLDVMEELKTARVTFHEHVPKYARFFKNKGKLAVPLFNNLTDTGGIAWRYRIKELVVNGNRRKAYDEVTQKSTYTTRRLMITATRDKEGKEREEWTLEYKQQFLFPLIRWIRSLPNLATLTIHLPGELQHDEKAHFTLMDMYSDILLQYDIAAEACCTFNNNVIQFDILHSTQSFLEFKQVILMMSPKFILPDTVMGIVHSYISWKNPPPKRSSK